MCAEWHRIVGVCISMDYNAGSSIIIMPYIILDEYYETTSTANAKS